MTLRIPAKVLLHVWSYDFYDMTLSTSYDKEKCDFARMVLFLHRERRNRKTLLEN